MFVPPYWQDPHEGTIAVVVFVITARFGSESARREPREGALCRAADIESLAADYLSGFVARLLLELDFGTPHLEVKKEFRNTPMDFPRPSPSLFVCLPEFWFDLMDIPEVAVLAGALPHVKPPPRKPEKIPTEWLRVQLLPTTLLPMDELAPRFLAWRAAQETQLPHS